MSSDKWAGLVFAETSADLRQHLPADEVTDANLWSESAD